MKTNLILLKVVQSNQKKITFHKLRTEKRKHKAARIC